MRARLSPPRSAAGLEWEIQTVSDDPEGWTKRLPLLRVREATGWAWPHGMVATGARMTKLLAATKRNPDFVIWARGNLPIFQILEF